MLLRTCKNNVNKKENSLDYFVDNGTMNTLNVLTLTNRADPGERVNWVATRHPSLICKE